MTASSASERPDTGGPLIRIGGAALLISFAIHIVANLVLKEFPPSDPTLEELKAYLAAQSGTWNVVHGMRYLAVVGLSVFYAGLLMRTRSPAGARTGGWEYVGLIGGVLHVANLLIANGVEMLAFADFGLLSERQELFWFALHQSRILFDAELVAWAIAIFGFSAAGWNSGALPKWIAVVGFLSAAFGVLAAATIGPMMTGHWIGVAFEFTTFPSLIWFFSVGVLMLWKGAR